MVGGAAEPGYASSVYSGAELYDAPTGTFVKTGAPSANTYQHTATLLRDGRVLITGGGTAIPGTPGIPPLRRAEIYDPGSGRFSDVGPMQVARNSHFAVLLSNGKVLVGGGYGDMGTAELFDPESGVFTPTGSMSTPRADAGATLLSDGQVLVEGGYGRGPAFVSVSSAELYNPATGRFTPAGSLGLARGGHTATLLPGGGVLVTGGSVASANLNLSSAEVYTPLTQGLVTSQTGLTFRAAEGATTAPPQTVAVLSPADTIPWTLSLKTYSGGSWLRATPASGSSTPTGAPITLSISVDPSGLAPLDYYGAVTLTPTDGLHPPVSVGIVLNIVAAGTAAPPSVSPSGLVFLSQSGISPAAQSFTISNFTSQAFSFTATGSPAAAWFDFNPKAGTVMTAPVKVTVTPSSASLLTGVYRGSIKISFSDASTQTVDLLLVVSPAPAPRITPDRGADAACTPARLLPVLTSIGSGYAAPAAWPIPLIVQVVDDCGAALSTGSVNVSFSNGDPPLSLLALGDGSWSGTWVPVRTSPGSSVRVDARLPQPALNGTTQISVQVASNPKVPVVASGGVVSSGDYTGAPAAGLLVSIFGSALADGSAGINGLPLPQQLGSTQVVLGSATLPVLYVSENQVNVLIPYDTPLNAPLQLVVQRANAVSVPVTTAAFDAQPAILATAGGGVGQGHIYKSTAEGGQVLADAHAPASAGDALVIYCVGLGAVTPAVNAGDAAPRAPLAMATAPVTVTIGGQSTQPFFAGLTPGFAGLYQVNVTLPAGVTPGDQVPVTVNAGGKSSAGAIYMAVK